MFEFTYSEKHMLIISFWVWPHLWPRIIIWTTSNPMS